MDLDYKPLDLARTPVSYEVRNAAFLLRLRRLVRRLRKESRLTVVFDANVLPLQVTVRFGLDIGERTVERFHDAVR